MSRSALLAVLLAGALAAGAPAVWAQQQQQQGQTQTSGQQNQQGSSAQSGTSPTTVVTPAPPGQNSTQPGESAGASNSNAGLATVTQPLTGAEQYTLSRMGAGRSYLIPSFQFAQSVSTGGTGPFGTANLSSVSTLSGSFDLNYVRSRYAFSARYDGTGFLYNQQSQYNNSAHLFTLSQRIMGRRSSFLVSDAVSYLPEASFGYSRFNGVGSGPYNYGGLYGGNISNLNTSYLPSQSILTGASSRVSNTVVGEYEYALSPLSSFTMTGSYALLRFPSSSFINSDDVIAQVGYNRTLSPRNTLAISYQAGIFRYNQSQTDFTNHVVQLVFGRMLTDRLHFQVGAGPQFNIFNTTAQNGTDWNPSWQLSSMLNYQMRRFSIGLNYQHYTSGGSGIYQGAQTDYGEVSLTTPLSPRTTIDWDMGYARNRRLQNQQAGGTSDAYHTWYGTVNVQRLLNRWVSVFASYNLQQQIAPSPICIGATCGTFYTQQYFSFGLNWHPSRVPEQDQGPLRIP
jgi:hypothetical protein